MSERPAVDVVVPFFGSGRQLVALLDRLQKLRLGPDDTLTVVDNRPVHASDRVDDPRVVLAPQVQSAPYSRNSGAQRGSNEWIVFIDADVDPAPDVIEQYFVTGPPADDVAVLAGAIHDQDPRQPERRTRPPRATCSYASAWPRPIPRRNCAKTANAAFRRSAFDAVGGFHTNLVCGEDVDLCYRLAAAGWRLEFRDEPVVEHIGRENVVVALSVSRPSTGRGPAGSTRSIPVSARRSARPIVPSANEMTYRGGA